MQPRIIVTSVGPWGVSRGRQSDDEINVPQCPLVMRANLTAGLIRRFALKLVTLLLLSFSLLGHSAHATCNPVGVPPVNLSLPASLVVPRDTPAGTVIYTSPVVYAAPLVKFNCDSNPGYTDIELLTPMTLVPGATNIFQTPVPGIGVKVYTAQQTYTFTSTLQSIYKYTANFTQNGAYHNYSIQFVATGPVSSGVVTLPSSLAGNYYSDSATSLVNSVLMSSLTISGSTVISAPACTTPDITVPLGSHARSEMTGLNTYTSSTGFNVSLNGCPAGMNTIKYRVDPVTTVVNSGQSVVALDGSSTAMGVGVQLLDGNGTIMPLATYKTFSGYNKSTGGSYAIPFRARYYQTAASVGPGAANTSMTFTMLYQ